MRGEMWSQYHRLAISSDKNLDIKVAQDVSSVIRQF